MIAKFQTVGRFGALASGLWLCIYWSASAYPTIATNFSPYFDEDGVWVEIARDKDKAPWIRAKGKVAASCQAIMKLVKNFSKYGELFSEAIDSVSMLAVTQPSTLARAHLVYGLPFPLSDRDAIIEYKAPQELMISWQDAAQPGDPTKGIRIEKVAGLLSLIPLTEQECEMVYAYYGELGGDLPAFIKERAWKHEPIYYFQAIRKAVK